MIQGFKKFIMRGNVIELAVAVVIADAFTPIVKNLVDSVINPLLGSLVGKPNFNSIGQFHIGDGDLIRPGTVLTAAIGFLLVAAAVYLVLVYPMNKLNERMARRKGLNAEEAEVSDEVRLLTEIRDALAGGGYMNERRRHCGWRLHGWRLSPVVNLGMMAAQQSESPSFRVYPTAS